MKSVYQILPFFFPWKIQEVFRHPISTEFFVGENVFDLVNENKNLKQEQILP